MSATRIFAGVALACSLLASAACVQYPTERESVVDLRPRVSFKFDGADPRLADARVTVDGLDAGRLVDFAEGKGALRVTSGSHVVRVINRAGVVFEERAYLGDGVARPFIVK